MRSLITYLLFLTAALGHEPQPKNALLNFMLDTAAESDEFATLFFWYLTVQQTESPNRNYDVAMPFLMARIRSELVDQLHVQIELVRKLADTVGAVANSKRDRPAKIERLREILGGSFGESLRDINPVIFPLCPQLSTTGIDASTATLYKSALLPLGLDWHVTRLLDSGGEADKANLTVRDGKLVKRTIFKKGDDLRQDQLVTSYLHLIDGLLSNAGLDLKTVVYRVLATGKAEGLIEVVPDATNISHVLEQHVGGIPMFLMTNNRIQASHSDAVENYIRSSAFYSIVTYFLGVGDRHLDNILLTGDGRLFHVDFGFILGRDPKPLPPAVRLTREMIDGMGGIGSNGFQSYLRHCCVAYRILRRYAPLLINVFSCVCDSLPGLDPAKDVGFLFSRLRLDLDDDAASEHISKIISDSANALFPQLMEKVTRMIINCRQRLILFLKVHKAAQKNRK